MHCFSCDAPLLDDAEFCSRCGARRLDPVPDPLIGSVVGERYRITRLIGEGGMGAVYEAEQRMGSSLRRVAVKLLLPEFSRNPTLRRRFHAECASLARLEHPNTVDVYDFGETKAGRLYLVMELVRGQSLDTVSQRALAPERAEHIVRQVGGALHEAHLLGIVHRDLKPENIVLTNRAGEQDFAKLLDFGIALDMSAQQKTRLTAAGTVLGTPPYMSPEQLQGAALDPRSDVYSLGVITYELLTGRLPFAANGPWEWAQRHMHDEPAPFDWTAAGEMVPEAVRSVVLAALAKRPDRRPPSARAFAEQLSAAVCDSRSPVGHSVAPPLAFPLSVGVRPPQRTDAALAAPALPAPSRSSSRAWVILAFFLPMLALAVSAAAVGGAWMLTRVEPQPAAPPAPPPLVMLEPDVDQPISAGSPSAASTVGSPAPSTTPSAAASVPSAPARVSTPAREPSPVGSVRLRPRRPQR